MKIRKLAFSYGILVLFAVVFSTAAQADLYWESETVSNGVPFQQNGTTIQKNYFTSGAYRLEPGDGNIIIIDYDLMKFYTLDPRARTYVESNLNQMGMPLEVPGVDSELLGRMMGGMGVQVTPTGETRTIAGYKCVKFIVDIAVVVHGEYWVSRDVKGYREVKAAAASLGKALQNNPMLGQINIAGMVEKLDGFPVKTTNRIMGGTAVSTLKKVEQRRLDAKLFRVPGDYTLKQ